MATIDLLHAHFREHYTDLTSAIILDRNELTLIAQPERWLSLAQRLKEDPATAFNLLVDVCGVDYLHYGLDEWQTESASLTGFGRGSVWFNDDEHHSQGDKTASDDPCLAEVVQGDKSITEHYLTEAEPSKNAYACNDMLQDTSTSSERTRFAVVYHLLSLPHNHRVRVRVPVADAAQPIINSVIPIWPAANWYEREVFDLFGILFHGHPDLRRLLTDYGFIGHPFRKDFPLIGKVEVRYDATLKRVIYHPVSIEPRVLGPKVIRHDARYSGANRGETHGK